MNAPSEARNNDERHPTPDNMAVHVPLSLWDRQAGEIPPLPQTRIHFARKRIMYGLQDLFTDSGKRNIMNAIDSYIQNVCRTLVGTCPPDVLRTIEDAMYLNSKGFAISQVEILPTVYDGGDTEMLKSFIIAKGVEGLSERSIRQYVDEMRKFLKFINKHIKDITTPDVRAYLADGRSKGYTDKSINNKRRFLGAFFFWAEREGLVSCSPCRHIPSVKEHKVRREAFTDMQMELIRQECRCLRDQAIVELLYSSGIRISELTSLNISDMDFNACRFTVLGKGGKERICFFSARCNALLSKYLKTRKDSSVALFISHGPFADKDGVPNRLSSDAIRGVFNTIGRRLGLKIHPHKFRRTTATTALRNGMPLEQISRLLGHEKLDTTMIYASLLTEDIQRSHRQLIR